MTNQDAGELAEQAAELVRALNHATRSEAGELEYPSDVYKIVGSLQTLAERLPQLFGQLAAFLMAEANADRIGHSSGGSPRTWIDDVLEALTKASDSADELAADLDRAHNAASGLQGAGWA